jgi:NTE family protein
MQLERVSSVSGGSIAAATLGLCWNRLRFDANGVASNLISEFVMPVRGLAGKTIDEGSIVSGIFTPGSIADKVADNYRKYLLANKTLQDLPDRPRFIINSTNVQTGVLWRFSKRHMADYKVGVILRSD